jgi:hypothetical protein
MTAAEPKGRCLRVCAERVLSALYEKKRAETDPARSV